MRIPRHVVARKKQWLVALPAQLRAHLRLTPGAMVWWHIGRKGMVSLTTSGHVRAGRPRADEDCPTCAKLRAELDRYRRELRDGESAAPGQWWRQGYMQALGDLGNVSADMKLALALLKEIAGGVRRRPATNPSQRTSRRRATETSPGPDHYPPPDPSPVPAPAERGDGARLVSSEEAARDFDAGAVQIPRPIPPPVV
jgi:hypothetical protein